MSALQIIGSIVCFLAVLSIPGTYLYYAWKEGEFSSDKKEEKHA